MFKQKAYVLMLFTLFISLSAFSQYPITIGNLLKNCEDILEENIVNYKLCEGWALDESVVIDIVQHAEVTHIFNPVRDLSPFDMLIYYSSDVIIDNIPYLLTIYATSWLSFYNKETHGVKYYYCKSERCAGYFIGYHITESLLSELDRETSVDKEDELVKRLLDNKEKVVDILKNNIIDAKWFKTYSFPDYELIIDKNGCEIKNLADSSTVHCYALAKNGLYIFSALQTEKRYVDFTYLNKTRFNDGDFIFKIRE